MLGAIAIVGREIPAARRGISAEDLPRAAADILAVPLVCADVLGRSVVQRVVDQFDSAHVDTISFFADGSLQQVRDEVNRASGIRMSWAEDAWASAFERLRLYHDGGIETTLLVRVNAYAEFDLRDALQSHLEESQEDQPLVTRVWNEDGPLDIWVIDSGRVRAGADIGATLHASQCARYVIHGYVNRLQSRRDLRLLAMDGLKSRCRLRPQGFEVRPGVWMDEAAQVHRGARIVAPAFIGRGAKIEDQCLITRCSNVESNCEIDYGTVVEDSSILSDTYVGIGLDVSHSIVNGRTLMNLKRDVIVEMADPYLIERNAFPRGKANRPPTAVRVANAEF